VLAEIIEQGGERRELAADAGVGKFTLLQVLAPGDDMARVAARNSAMPPRPAKAMNSSTSIL